MSLNLRPVFVSLTPYNWSFMPTATPRKSTSTTPRKRRTRKATAPKAVKTVPTIKEVKQMTVETPVRPTPLLKFEDYQKDFNIRLEIHNYEIKELIKDIKWVYEQSKPLVKQGYDYVVSSYNRAFVSE
tara:strand:- start:1224 stop:1607 length:384 start_codon:yes stop_codon:yes gene_type:complete